MIKKTIAIHIFLSFLCIQNTIIFCMNSATQTGGDFFTTFKVACLLTHLHEKPDCAFSLPAPVYPFSKYSGSLQEYLGVYNGYCFTLFDVKKNNQKRKPQ